MFEGLGGDVRRTIALVGSAARQGSANSRLTHCNTSCVRVADRKDRVARFIVAGIAVKVPLLRTRR